MAAAVAPGSPSKAALHRTDAKSVRHKGNAQPNTILQDGNAADPSFAISRGRSMAPRSENTLDDSTARSPPLSPNKENRPLFTTSKTHDDASAAKYGNLRRRECPTVDEHDIKEDSKHKSGKRGKVRARSVSPSKFLRLRGGTNREKDTEQEASKAAQQAKQHHLQHLNRSPSEVEQEFLGMLIEMQVPSSLMQKLKSLDIRVKESMLRGQATLNVSTWQASSNDTAPPPPSSSSRLPISDRFMRSKSSVHLAESRSSDEVSADVTQSVDQALNPKCHPDTRKSSSSSSSASAKSPVMGQSKTHSMQQGLGSNALASVSTTSLNTVRSRSTSFAKDTSNSSGALASTYATMLKANDAAHLDVGRIKKMRAVLSAESPAWLEDFFEHGGYEAMVVRLKELVAMEWREEQHDDQLLHELLRCFVALASTDCGRQALSSSMPTPFYELCDLLFSEKRPGELGTRKLLVEILQLLADLPTRGGASSNQTTSVDDVVCQSRESSELSKAIPYAAFGNFGILMTLLHNQRDPSKEAVVDFITATHTPRPFKTWVVEMLNVNRDYFWVFCHSSNRYWALDDVNAQDALSPKVPGGMTGGVEFEAMSYLTAHFRLVNLAAERFARMDKRSTLSSKSGTHLAFAFHALMFASGFERTLAVTRKASQTYYQPLHLEMARYFDFARRAGFGMPVELEAWQSSPQLLFAAPARGSAHSSRDTSYKVATANKDTDERRSTDAPDRTSVMLEKPLFNPYERAPSAPKQEQWIGGSNPTKHLQIDTQPQAHGTSQAPSLSNKQQANQGQGTIVGDAVRKWETRATLSNKPTNKPLPSATNAGANNRTSDSAFVWAPPKEWS